MTWYIIFSNQAKPTHEVSNNNDNDVQVLKWKCRKFIVESDTDEDQSMNFSTKEIEVATNFKSTKQEALKKVLTTRERLSKRIKSIDCIIATGKMNNNKN